MEDTNSVGVSVSHTGNLQMAHSNRVHVRVSVGGNELEFTDERVYNQATSSNFQEIISSFTEIMKAAANTTIGHNTIEPENIRQDKNARKLLQERQETIDLLKVVIAGNSNKVCDRSMPTVELNQEVLQLRQLLKESQEEKDRLEIRFRSATHMKAKELTEQFSQVNTVHNAKDGCDIDPVSGLAEVYTPKQRPEEFILNPQVKEIDFFSLDDVLSNDSVYVPSRRTTEDLCKEDDNIVMTNAGSGSGTISGDHESYFDRPSTEAFVIPRVTPPSVLKVGLDVDRSRAGGEYTAENSYESPRHRSPRHRGRFNNDDSYAEREFGMQANKDQAGPNDGFSSMVDTYGITYKPLTQDGSDLKGIHIDNLPETLDYQRLLGKVRGGSIISATLCNPIRVEGRDRRMSAFVVFLNAESARSYVDFANRHPISFDSQKAVVKLIQTPTFPLSIPARRRIYERKHTRCLIIYRYRCELSLAKIDHVINAGVNQHRVDAIERFWKDEDGNIRIRFASINAASMAYGRLTNHRDYDRLEIAFTDDPCGRPLSELIPSPTGRRVSDSRGMKLEYDDGDRPEDESSSAINTINTTTSSKVNNVDEIELDDHNDNDDSPVDENKAMKIEIFNEKKPSDEAKTSNGSETVDYRNMPIEVKLASTGTMEPMRAEDYKETLISETLDILKTEVPLGNDDVLKLENVSKAEDFRTSDESGMLESGDISRSVTQLTGSSSSNDSSAITTTIPMLLNERLESWADDVNDAIEDGTLQPPMEPEHVPPTKLITFDEEPFHQAYRFLSTIIEEDLLSCEPFEEDHVAETVANAPASGFFTTEISVPELTITKTPVKQYPIDSAPVTASSAELPLVDAAPCGKPAVKLPSPAGCMIPNKFDLTGTDLDPVLLPRYVLETVLSSKPRKGLSASRWAQTNTEATPLIIIEAPKTVPTLARTVKPAPKPVISLAPANAPKGPKPMTLPRKSPCDLAGSRYTTLATAESENDHPQSSLRNFYTAVDLQRTAATPKKPSAAPTTTAEPTPAPVTPAPGTLDASLQI